ncbi:hypothetical protein ACFU5O_10140 [Streptomyces sp. NPDC057445]|uniref:hypothetical protein n=1 Tax=Streptomyces sp. NPDC057445 TaxID=3346136 RepID=UPI0036C3BDBC
MPASEHEATQPRPRSRPQSPSALSMRDLLASCAAASAVSTPPSERDEAAPEPSVAVKREERRDAA